MWHDIIGASVWPPVLTLYGNKVSYFKNARRIRVTGQNSGKYNVINVVYESPDTNITVEPPPKAIGEGGKLRKMKRHPEK